MAALDFPLRFADLKKRILKEEDKGIVIKAWAEVLEDLNNATNEFMKIGSSVRALSVPLAPIISHYQIYLHCSLSRKSISPNSKHYRKRRLIK
jgi:hypothetical protein